jgi:hypothetical protein
MIVYNKTGKRCSICGSKENLTCVCFIPEWTRIIETETENLIPMCDDCRYKRGKNFIEIGTLSYLPDIYIQQLLRFYKSISMYLYKYVRLYGESRTNSLIDIKKTLLIMQSYDNLIKEKKEELNWENLK